MSVELKNSIQHVGAAIANSDDCAATLIEHLIKCDYECDYSLTTISNVSVHYTEVNPHQLEVRFDLMCNVTKATEGGCVWFEFKNGKLTAEF